MRLGQVVMFLALLGLMISVPVLGALVVDYFRSLNASEQPKGTDFRPLGELDRTFRPLTTVTRAIPSAAAARAPCWICSRPKDGHRHE